MRSVVLHAVLAAVGLTWAYLTWTRVEQEERPPGEVTVAECGSDQLESIQLETPTHTIDVAPVREGRQTSYWITSTRKPPKAKDEAKAKDMTRADAGAVSADGGTPPAPEPPKKEAAPPAPKRFLASQKFDDYAARLSPVRAIRGLGKLADGKLEDFGFDNVGTFMRIQCAGRRLELEVGARTYGTGSRYARDSASGQVYLFEGKFVQDLQSARYKFMQSALHPFVSNQVDEARVTALGSERRLLQRNRKVPKQARWVDAAEPDKRNELYGNFFSRVARLKIKDYLDQGTAPGDDLAQGKSGGALQPVVEIHYKAEALPPQRMELLRMDVDGKPRYYARSTMTQGWVTVFESVARQVQDDVPMMVGVDAPPAAAPAAPAAPAANLPVPGANPHVPVANPHVPGANPHGSP